MSLARPVLAPVLVGLLAAASLAAGAQQIYRIVGPDGRVTFSDRPPPEGSARASIAPVLTLPAGSETTASLPFELRSVVTRYPVTLYSRPGCTPCDGGRRYLTQRGVPFNERTVTSQEDIEALQRLAGTPTLPFMTIGAQQLKGFSEIEWAQFLDAAGYPKTSQLPSAYRQPPAAPLVAAAPAQTPPSAAPLASNEPAPSPSTPAPPAASPSNPAGIRF